MNARSRRPRAIAVPLAVDPAPRLVAALAAALTALATLAALVAR